MSGDTLLLHLPRESRIQLFNDEVNAIHLVTLWDLVDVLNTGGDLVHFEVLSALLEAEAPGCRTDLTQLARLQQLD